MALGAFPDLDLLTALIAEPRDEPETPARREGVPLKHRRPEPVATYGPRSEPVVALLDRARGLTADQIESLAQISAQTSHSPSYAEAMLAARQAAERSGRAAAIGRAATEAERIVITIAGARRLERTEDPVRWSIVGQRAAWGASDAALAVAVGDLLPQSQLRTLTRAWDRIG